MYAVVGCGDCQALWLVGGRPDTTRCPRCGTRREFDRLRKLAETDDQTEARRARTALLAARQDRDFESQTDQAGGKTGDGQTGDHEAGPSPLGGKQRPHTMGTHGTTDSSSSASSRIGVVQTALRVLECPDEAAVIHYATDRGIEADAAEAVLRRLVRAGEVVRQGDGYRRV